MSARDARTSRTSEGPPELEPAIAGVSASPPRTASAVMTGAISFGLESTRPITAPPSALSVGHGDPGAVGFAVRAPAPSHGNCYGLALFPRYGGDPAPARGVVRRGDRA